MAGEVERRDDEDEHPRSARCEVAEWRRDGRGQDGKHDECQHGEVKRRAHFHGVEMVYPPVQAVLPGKRQHDDRANGGGKLQGATARHHAEREYN